MEKYDGKIKTRPRPEWAKDLEYLEPESLVRNYLHLDKIIIKDGNEFYLWQELFYNNTWLQKLEENEAKGKTKDVQSKPDDKVLTYMLTNEISLFRIRFLALFLVKCVHQ